MVGNEGRRCNSALLAGWRRTSHRLAVVATLGLAVPAAAAPGGPRPSPAELLERPESIDACRAAALGEERTCRYDYTWREQSVEAVITRPAGEGPFPGVLLIPGHRRRALDMQDLATVLAQRGVASVAITLPGYGNTHVRPDYVGPVTLAMLGAGLDAFEREGFVDRSRIGVFGSSRGGMAASLLVLRRSEIRAAVFSAGIYDFRRAHDETRVARMRENMERETGMTPSAIEERSSILHMEALRCPVLILHGEKDENVPVGNALALRDRLTALGKDVELRLFPELAHGLPAPAVNAAALTFFEARLLRRSAGHP